MIEYNYDEHVSLLELKQNFEKQDKSFLQADRTAFLKFYSSLELKFEEF